MGTPPTIEFASLGIWDSLILMVLALVVFGPRRLPEIGRKLGRVMYEIRKASNDFKFQMEEELRKAGEVDQRQREEERLRVLAAPAGTPVTDSPVRESRADAPGSGPALTPVQTPAPSPYPGEDAYPELIAAAPAAGEQASTAPADASGAGSEQVRHG
jgi:sec-independent protein translocase protein TatB